MNGKQKKQISEEQKKRRPGGAIKSVRTSCSGIVGYNGEKSYRTVFGLQEVQELFVDTELVNKRYEEEKWDAEVAVRLFWFDGKKAECVAEKSDKMTVEKEDVVVWYEESFSGSDFSEFTFREGIYRVLVEVNGVGAQSDDLYFMEGNGQTECYFQAVRAGIDKCCEETETESNGRPHSFQGLNLAKLNDVRFYMLARNLLEQEWVYEFVVRVFSRNGRMKTERFVKSGQYVKNPEGNSLLCFAVELGGGEENFWTEGEYTLLLSCFDRLVFTLNFNIGDKDIPYDFGSEVSGRELQLSVNNRSVSVYSEEGKEEVLDRVYRLVGLRRVKEEITQICEYAEFIRLRIENGFRDTFPPMHMIFTGHPGTGKNTVAEMIGELFHKLGILTHGRVNHYRRKDLVCEGTASEEQLVRQALAVSAGGVLFVDRAGELFNPENPDDRGMMALTLLCNILIRENPDILVILADDADEMAEILNAMSDLKKIFPRQLCFEDYSPEELMEITRNKLEKLEFTFTPAAEEKFFKLLRVACVAKELDFTNGRFIDDQLEAAALCMSKRLMANRMGNYKKEDLMQISEVDILEEPEANPSESLGKLNTMVGLGTLKQSITQHLNYVYFIRERQKQGFADVMPPLNMIFSGNPGTGKMTVAKLMGEIYHSIGVLSQPNVVMQNGHHLTGDSGISPEQTASVLLDAADGGILYIEDADVLPQTPFGLALLEILLASVPTEECGDFVLILAGYPDHIQTLLEMNRVLKNYFPYQFEFNDYTPEELLEIAESSLKEKKYMFQPEARKAFEVLIRKAYEKRDKRFGNALLVEKMVDTVIHNMSSRTMKIRQERELTRKEITTIRLVDVPVDTFEVPKFVSDIFDENEITLALKDLDRIVGQVGIKKQIRDFVNLARHYSQQGIKLNSRMSLQWCFTGNSSMGKGTVARIIGRIYKAMGVVDKGHVLDFKVEKLIGQMEDEAQRSIGEALAKSSGGIFLFDEDSVKLNEAAGFKERVRAILMNQMAERPGAYTVIYAEPKTAVPGFNGDAEHISEIINVLIFEDYSKEELMVILKRRLAKENMQLTQTARQHMVQFIACVVSTEERSHASSRLMRIVADMIVRNCVQRVAKDGVVNRVEDLISVQKQDVGMFTEKFVTELMNERKKIGYKI